ncbi:uncharacterized protein [Halyomorpha halys]|uniref:uncharacterized protein n=1 Tax=Halyomorpha halys TaxID=286706 RepID=UPI0006D4D607|nr:uncharacterized protein LOC106681291 [Halyomorpha halys]
MKECTIVDSRQRGRSYSSNIIYVTLLVLWMTVDCLAAPSIPPPPHGLTLGPDEQAMLEALVDEAIAQEEILRNRRHEASKRFSGSIPKDEHHGHHDEYGPPPLDYKTKAFSLWSFKKAILSALVQSIKAITGGVIALSGQLVKVKGHLVAAKGKLLETKGDAISEFGKHLATKALLTPMHSSSSYDHSSTGSGTGSTGSGYSYTPPSSHGGHYPPAAPPSSYGPPGHDSHGSQPSHPPAPSYGPPGHGSHSFDYNGPPPSNNYLPPTAAFNSAPESWLMAAGHYAEPPSIHHEIHHHTHHDLHNLQQGHHHPIQKKEVPKGLQAGLILLKPVKEVDLLDNPSFNQPKAFSKNPTLIEIHESKVKKSS